MHKVVVKNELWLKRWTIHFELHKTGLYHFLLIQFNIILFGLRIVHNTNNTIHRKKKTQQTERQQWSSRTSQSFVQQVDSMWYKGVFMKVIVYLMGNINHSLIPEKWQLKKQHSVSNLKLCPPCIPPYSNHEKSLMSIKC